jgi:hypothetical protein
MYPVRDLRARQVPDEERAQATGVSAGSHSVVRIVRVFHSEKTELT